MRNEINDICGQISNLIGDLSGMETQLNAESEAAAYRAAKIIQGEQRRIFAKANFKRDKKSHKYKFASGSHIEITERNRQVSRENAGRLHHGNAPRIPRAAVD